MPVEDRLMALGRGDVTLNDDTPPDIWDQLSLVDQQADTVPHAAFGTIVITEAPIIAAEAMGPADDPETEPHPLLELAAHSFVYRSRRGNTIGGPGPAMWLGDEDNKGELIEFLPTLTRPWIQWMGLLVAGDDSFVADDSETYSYGACRSLFGGNITDVQNGDDVIRIDSHVDSRRRYFDYLCAYFGTEWRVRPSMRIDAGYQADLYPDVNTLIAWNGGDDPAWNTMRARIEQSADLDDWATRVCIGEVSGSGMDSEGANLPYTTRYRTPKGEVVWMTKPPSGVDTYALATDHLMKVRRPNRTLTIDGTVHQAYGPLVAGETVEVWAPLERIRDQSRPGQMFRGQTIFPERMRLHAVRRPITAGCGVYLLRFDPAGTPHVLDLTPWVKWETGPVTVEVGAPTRTLTSAPTLTDVLRASVRRTAADTTTTFTYQAVAEAQTFTAPWAGTAEIELFGGQGGDFDGNGTRGGRGGRAYGTMVVAEGDVITVHVGGAGTHDPTSDDPVAGWNGGGEAGNTGEGSPTSASRGGGGGGATDIRVGGTALADRALVAGGGGGGAGINGGAAGGAGGYTAGISGGAGGAGAGGFGAGGTGSAGGAGGAGGSDGDGTADNGGGGTLGVGGDGGHGYTYSGGLDRTYGGGGGGGGWYGGGGGGGGPTGAEGGAGGGGSSGADSGVMSDLSFEDGVQVGAGLAVIRMRR